MAEGIYTALSGAIAQNDALDVVSNNVANAGTAGYRSSRIRFDEALGRAQLKDNRLVRTGVTTTDESAGPVTQTNNPFDLAINGDGWFVIDTPHGQRYTRAGDFRLDGSGTLVTPDGCAVMGKGGGSLTVPAGSRSVVMGEDGSMTVDGQALGSVDVARFAKGTLSREGATRFVARAGAVPADDGRPAQLPSQLMVGALEGGNFNIVRGVVELVKVSRTYEALHRMIESYKETQSRAARSIGGNG